MVELFADKVDYPGTRRDGDRRKSDPPVPGVYVVAKIDELAPRAQSADLTKRGKNTRRVISVDSVTQNPSANNARLPSGYLDSSKLIAPKTTKARCANTGLSVRGKLRVVSGQSAQPGKSPVSAGEVPHFGGARQDWSYNKKVKLYEQISKA